MNRTRGAKAPRTYLDSCIFIEVIQGITGVGGDHKDSFETCLQLLRDFEQGNYNLVMSELVYTETFHRGEAKLTDRRLSQPARGKTLKTASDLIDSWFQRAEIIRVEVHQGITEQARRLALSCRLDSHDAVHLVTAREEGCETFITLDKKLVECVGGVDLGMRVEMPSAEWGGQTSLLIPGQPRQPDLKVISGDGAG